MAKTTFTEKELMVLQIALLVAKPEKILARFPIASDDLKHLMQSTLQKVTELLINPNDPSLHPLAVTRAIFDEQHDKIKGAIDLMDDPEKVTPDAETQSITELLGIIGVMCGKQLIQNQVQIIGPSII